MTYNFIDATNKMLYYKTRLLFKANSTTTEVLVVYRLLGGLDSTAIRVKRNTSAGKRPYLDLRITCGNRERAFSSRRQMSWGGENGMVFKEGGKLKKDFMIKINANFLSPSQQIVITNT